MEEHEHLDEAEEMANLQLVSLGKSPQGNGNDHDDGGCGFQSPEPTRKRRLLSRRDTTPSPRMTMTSSPSPSKPPWSPKRFDTNANRKKLAELPETMKALFDYSINRPVLIENGQTKQAEFIFEDPDGFIIGVWRKDGNQLYHWISDVTTQQWGQMGPDNTP